MKLTKMVLKVVGVLMLMSFMFNINPEFRQYDDNLEKNIVGVYGEANMLALTLNSDHTFHYVQFKNNEKTEVSGNWMLTNNTLNLVDQSNKKYFLNSWTVENNGGSLKTKKRMTTYTIVKHCK